MLKGITITLIERVETGNKDVLNHPTYTEHETTVDNILVAPALPQEIQDALDLYGYRIQYQLAIPKGDQHKWKGGRVKFFGGEYEVVGEPVYGIDELIPGPWNGKVGVKAYG